ncbi:MAG: helix-turn-helix transcriptional regulator [Pseudomonadota bacterium]
MYVVIDGIQYVPLSPIGYSEHSLSALLIHCRKVLGYSLEEAAQRVGCSVELLVELELGFEPSLGQVLAIAKAYWIPFEVFVAAYVKDHAKASGPNPTI